MSSLKDVGLKDVGLKDVSLKDVVVPYQLYYNRYHNITVSDVLADGSMADEILMEKIEGQVL